MSKELIGHVKSLKSYIKQTLKQEDQVFKEYQQLIQLIKKLPFNSISNVEQHIDTYQLVLDIAAFASLQKDEDIFITGVKILIEMIPQTNYNQNLNFTMYDDGYDQLIGKFKAKQIQTFIQFANASLQPDYFNNSFSLLNQTIKLMNASQNDQEQYYDVSIKYDLEQLLYRIILVSLTNSQVKEENKDYVKQVLVNSLKVDNCNEVRINPIFLICLLNNIFSLSPRDIKHNSHFQYLFKSLLDKHVNVSSIYIQTNSFLNISKQNKKVKFDSDIKQDNVLVISDICIDESKQKEVHEESDNDNTKQEQYQQNKSKYIFKYTVINQVNEFIPLFREQTIHFVYIQLIFQFITNYVNQYLNFKRELRKSFKEVFKYFMSQSNNQFLFQQVMQQCSILATSLNKNNNFLVNIIFYQFLHTMNINPITNQIFSLKFKNSDYLLILTFIKNQLDKKQFSFKKIDQVNCSNLNILDFGQVNKLYQNEKNYLTIQNCYLYKCCQIIDQTISLFVDKQIVSTQIQLKKYQSTFEQFIQQNSNVQQEAQQEPQQDVDDQQKITSLQEILQKLKQNQDYVNLKEGYEYFANLILFDDEQFIQQLMSINSQIYQTCFDGDTQYYYESANIFYLQIKVLQALEQQDCLNTQYRSFNINLESNITDLSVFQKTNKEIFLNDIINCNTQNEKLQCFTSQLIGSLIKQILTENQQLHTKQKFDIDQFSVQQKLSINYQIFTNANRYYVFSLNNINQLSILAQQLCNFVNYFEDNLINILFDIFIVFMQQKQQINEYYCKLFNTNQKYFLTNYQITNQQKISQYIDKLETNVHNIFNQCENSLSMIQYDQLEQKQEKPLQYLGLYNLNKYLNNIYYIYNLYTINLMKESNNETCVLTNYAYQLLFNLTCPAVNDLQQTKSNKLQLQQVLQVKINNLTVIFSIYFQTFKQNIKIQYQQNINKNDEQSKDILQMIIIQINNMVVYQNIQLIFEYQQFQSEVKINQVFKECGCLFDTETEDEKENKNIQLQCHQINRYITKIFTYYGKYYKIFQSQNKQLFQQISDLGQIKIDITMEQFENINSFDAMCLYQSLLNPNDTKIIDQLKQKRNVFVQLFYQYVENFYIVIQLLIENNYISNNDIKQFLKNQLIIFLSIFENNDMLEYSYQNNNQNLQQLNNITNLIYMIFEYITSDKQEKLLEQLDQTVIFCMQQTILQQESNASKLSLFKNVNNQIINNTINAFIQNHKFEEIFKEFYYQLISIRFMSNNVELFFMFILQNQQFTLEYKIKCLFQINQLFKITNDTKSNEITTQNQQNQQPVDDTQIIAVNNTDSRQLLKVHFQMLKTISTLENFNISEQQHIIVTVVHNLLQTVGNKLLKIDSFVIFKEYIIKIITEFKQYFCDSANNNNDMKQLLGILQLINTHQLNHLSTLQQFNTFENDQFELLCQTMLEIVKANNEFELINQLESAIISFLFHFVIVFKGQFKSNNVENYFKQQLISNIDIFQNKFQIIEVLVLNLNICSVQLIIFIFGVVQQLFQKYELTSNEMEQLIQNYLSQLQIYSNNQILCDNKNIVGYQLILLQCTKMMQLYISNDKNTMITRVLKSYTNYIKLIISQIQDSLQSNKKSEDGNNYDIACLYIITQQLIEGFEKYSKELQNQVIHIIFDQFCKFEQIDNQYSILFDLQQKKDIKKIVSIINLETNEYIVEQNNYIQYSIEQFEKYYFKTAAKVLQKLVKNKQIDEQAKHSIILKANVNDQRNIDLKKLQQFFIDYVTYDDLAKDFLKLLRNEQNDEEEPQQQK